MTAARRFLFDTDFDELANDDAANADESDAAGEDAPDATEEPEAPTYSEEELEDARAEARQEGMDEAAEQFARSLESEVLTLIRAIAQNLTALSEVQERENSERTREAVAVAQAICNKLIPDMVEKNAVGEVERAVRDAVRDLNETPRIVLSVSPALRGPLADRLENVVAGAGYDGRIDIVEDETLEHGDCVMSWGDGGAERRLSDLWRKVNAVVEDGIGEAAQSFERAQAQAAQDIIRKADVDAKMPGEEAAQPAPAAPDAPADSPETAPPGPLPPAPDAQDAASEDEAPEAEAEAADTVEADGPAPEAELETELEPSEPESMDAGEVVDMETEIPDDAMPMQAPSAPDAPLATDAPLQATTVRRAAISEDPFPADLAGDDDASDDGAGTGIVDGATDAALQEGPMDMASPFSPHDEADDTAATPPAPAPATPAGRRTSTSPLGFEIDEDAEEGGVVDDALDRALGTLAGGGKKPQQQSSQRTPAPAAPKSGGTSMPNPLGIEIDEDAEEGGVVDDALDRALGSLANKGKKGR